MGRTAPAASKDFARRFAYKSKKTAGRLVQRCEEFIVAHAEQWLHDRRQAYDRSHKPTPAIAASGDYGDAWILRRAGKSILDAFRIGHRARQQPAIRLILEPLPVALPPRQELAAGAIRSDV
jgi:hypothetical protein